MLDFCEKAELSGTMNDELFLITFHFVGARLDGSVATGDRRARAASATLGGGGPAPPKRISRLVSTTLGRGGSGCLEPEFLAHARALIGIDLPRVATDS